MPLLQNTALNRQQRDKVIKGVYAFDCIPEEIQATLDSPLLEGLISVVIRIHAAIRNPEPETRQEFEQLNRAIKAKETEQLRAWADERGHLQSPAEFEKNWEAQGRMRGAEHHVYYDESANAVIKRNIMGNHDTWLQYLQRIAIHNYLFPAVAYELTGMMEATDKTGKICLMPLVRQPDIHAAEGAQPDKVLQALFMAGFKVRQDEFFVKAGLTEDKWNRYLHPSTGIKIYDLLPKNALLTQNGNIAFIDGLIELEAASKIKRLKAKYGLEKAEPEAPINMAYLKTIDDSLREECQTMPRRSAQAFMEQTHRILTNATQNGEA